ncbi:MAG TPA: hypothetical protein V6D48_05990 [Oculatellaceae cyanobacterium]
MGGHSLWASSSQPLIPNPKSLIPMIQIRTGLLDGNQVMIRISDNGLGMTQEVARKVFDPFFTTKSVVMVQV